MTAVLLEAPSAQPKLFNTPTLPWGAMHNGMHRFTVEEYEKLVRLGILDESDQLELIEGYLVRKMSMKPPHSRTVNKVRKRLDKALPEAWDSQIQSPIRLSESVPEPDYVVFRGDDDDYRDSHPTARDNALVVEVADSSLEGDRTDKARIYARNGLPEYWIVNLEELQIEVYTQPQPQAEVPHYLKRVDYKFGDKVPFSLNGQVLTEFAVEEVFLRADAADEGE